MKPIILLILSALIFQETTAQNFKETTLDLEKYFKEQKKYLLKTSLTSPFLGNYSFSLEYAFKPRRTIEARYSFIHSSKVSTELIDGFYTGFGYKFFMMPIHSSKGKRTIPIFQGFYIQPELLLGFMNKNKFATIFFPPFGLSSIPNEKQKINYQVLLSNFGLQINLYNSLFLDIFGGVGIGTDNLLDTRGFLFGQNTEIYHQGILKADTGFSMAGKAGIRLGILL
ncbi:MAG: hypothetical protein AB8H03_12445 [Saprospiraceae bacterium]